MKKKESRTHQIKQKKKKLKTQRTLNQNGFCGCGYKVMTSFDVMCQAMDTNIKKY